MTVNAFSHTSYLLSSLQVLGARLGVWNSPSCPPQLGKPLGMPSFLVLACYKALRPELGSCLSLPGIVGTVTSTTSPMPCNMSEEQSHRLGPQAQKGWPWERTMFRSEGMLECFVDPSIQGYRKMTQTRVSCYFSTLFLSARRDCAQDHVPQSLLTT